MSTVELVEVEETVVEPVKLQQISEGEPDLPIVPPADPGVREVVTPALTDEDHAALRAAVLHVAEAVEAWIAGDGVGDTDAVTAAKEHLSNAVAVIEGAGTGGGTGGEAATLAVTGLVPATAVVGTPSFTLHVQGTGFGADAQIEFNGYPEPTTRVSDTEVTTGVDMAVWTAPSLPLPVAVRSGGVLSNTVDFQFLAGPEADTASRTHRRR